MHLWTCTQLYATTNPALARHLNLQMTRLAQDANIELDETVRLSMCARCAAPASRATQRTVVRRKVGPVCYYSFLALRYSALVLLVMMGHLAHHN
jgi:RNase P subunit RPR2